MERSRPGNCIRHYPGVFAYDVCHDAFYAPRHLCGRASREGQQHDFARVGAIDDEMRHTVRKRICLSRARTRDNQEGPCFGKGRSAVFDRATLLRVELVQIGHGHRGRRCRIIYVSANTALPGFAIAANRQAPSSALSTERPDCYLPTLIFG